MHKISILDAATIGDDISLSPITSLGNTEIFSWIEDTEVINKCADTEIIVTNKVQFTWEVLQALPKLKLICLTATGYNNVDIQTASKLGIGVANVKGYSTHAVAQHTIAMMFYLWENLSYFDQYVKEGGYAKSTLFTHLSRVFYETQRKIWGIIGLGAIGKKVAIMAEALGFQIQYYSTSGKNTDNEYPHKDLRELLASSDVVSIHCPLNDKTRGLIDFDLISSMKKESILLNLGRGGIIVEDDLARALDEGLIKGAGLDVLTKEPMSKDSPFLKMQHPERLLITPHIAWAPKEARERVIAEVAENIRSYLKGEGRNWVNP